MLLMPRKVKHRKIHRGGAIQGKTTRGSKVSFGTYGLKAMTGGLISARQIESARRAMTRHIQRGGSPTAYDRVLATRYVFLLLTLLTMVTGVKWLH